MIKQGTRLTIPNPHRGDIDWSLTSRILKQRIKSAAEGRTVSASAARKRIQRWLSKSSTTKTR